MNEQFIEDEMFPKYYNGVKLVTKREFLTIQRKIQLDLEKEQNDYIDQEFLNINSVIAKGATFYNLQKYIGEHQSDSYVAMCILKGKLLCNYPWLKFEIKSREDYFYISWRIKTEQDLVIDKINETLQEVEEKPKKKKKSIFNLFRRNKKDML